MDTNTLENIARELVAPGKGVLAADESTGSSKKRFESVGMEGTEENRRRYRQSLFQADQLNDVISGVILYEETFWQKTDGGQQISEYLAEKGVMPGIKVDKGLTDLPGFSGEKVTKGLDTLPEMVAEHAEAGAKFAKWRAVITIGDDIPTDECVGANTYTLARYARIAQEAGLVPMVEPEVLFDGTHSIDRCEEVTRRVYDILFQTMRAFRVHMPGAILKTGMILPGKHSGAMVEHQEIADRTVRVLKEHVPHDLGGVVFLSGGQTSRDAFVNLNLIEQRREELPWGVTFSYSRALQDSALKQFAADPENDALTTEEFDRMLGIAKQAREGTLSEEHSFTEVVTASQDL